LLFLNPLIGPSLDIFIARPYLLNVFAAAKRAPPPSLPASTFMVGTHLFVVRGAEIECLDVVSFAAIGAGDWHANSQFMFAKHNYNRPFSETLFATYVAKKRAEVAPGVGQATDMFMVGPLLGQCAYPLHPHINDKLEELYKEAISGVLNLATDINGKVKEFIELQLKTQQQAQKPSPPLTNPDTPPSDSPKPPDPPPDK
jgi:hypothetical protein